MLSSGLFLVLLERYYLIIFSVWYISKALYVVMLLVQVFIPPWELPSISLFMLHTFAILNFYSWVAL